MSAEAMTKPAKEPEIKVWYQRKNPRGWKAKVTDIDRTVLGFYASKDLARFAALAMHEIFDTDRLCTPPDIDRVRSELSKAK